MRFYKLNYLVVIFTILISGSLYYSSLFKNAFFVPLFFFLACNFLVSDQKLNKRKLFLLSLAFLLGISNLQSVPSSLIVLFTCIACALVITQMISFDDFSRCYIKIILFLSVVSWFYFPIVYFQIPSPLPDFISIVDTPYSNFALFGIYRAEMPAGFNDMYYVFRNSGLFWEPGAYQIFINSAVYLAMVQNQLSKLKLIIFFITILTVGSTTGFLVFAILAVVHFSRTRQNMTAKTNLIVLAFSIIACGIFVASGLLEKSIEKFHAGSSSNVSFIARSTDFLVDSSVLMDHFWRGVGYGNISVREQYAIADMGDTLYWSDAKPPGADGLLLFVSYLGFFGVVLIWRLIYPSQVQNWSLFEKGMVIVAMLMMYNNENMLMYLFPWVMTFYGFSVHSNPVKLNVIYDHKGLKASAA